VTCCDNNCLFSNTVEICSRLQQHKHTCSNTRVHLSTLHYPAVLETSATCPFLRVVTQGHLAAATHQAEAANGHAAAAAAAGPSVQQCTARLSAGLTAVTHYFQQQLQPSGAYLGCVLPGHVLSGAVLLLSESCCWLELCLQVRVGLRVPLRDLVCYLEARKPPVGAVKPLGMQPWVLLPCLSPILS
jgi:hypothetical protein